MPLFKKTLSEWVNISDLNIGQMSLNENAIDILQNNKKNINWINLAKNFNGFEIFKDNLCAFENKQCWDVFCKSTPEIPYLRHNINKINDRVIYHNTYAGKFIYEWFKNFFSDKFADEENLINMIYNRIITYNALISHNMYLNFTIRNIASTDKEIVEFLNGCSVGMLDLYEIPCSEHLINLWMIDNTKGKGYHKLTQMDITNTKSLNMDLYNLESCMYSTNIEYIEDVIKYVCLASNGLVHSHITNCRKFWKCTSHNPLALDLIEKYFPQMNKMNISCLFEAISSQPHAISFLEKHLDLINWDVLSKNPFAIHILKNNPDKINYFYLSENPYIFDYDYEEMRMNLAHTYGRELRKYFADNFDNHLFEDDFYTIFI